MLIKFTKSYTSLKVSATQYVARVERKQKAKKEVLKLLHAEIIYHVPHSEWVSPIQVVPKKEA
jgi:hypothetical protein